MQTTDASAPILEYIRTNLSTLTDKTIRELLDIPPYTPFIQYIRTTCTGEVIFAMQLVKGQWVDTTDIEQLRAKQHKTEQELDNLIQEAVLTHVQNGAKTSS